MREVTRMGKPQKSKSNSKVKSVKAKKMPTDPITKLDMAIGILAQKIKDFENKVNGLVEHCYDLDRSIDSLIERIETLELEAQKPQEAQTTQPLDSGDSPE